MRTRQELLNDAYQQLFSLSASARLDAELLLAAALKISREKLLMWSAEQVSASESADFTQLLTRRINGEPIAYILGCREFWSLPLSVNSYTLIPRPETECLVEVALTLLDAQINAQVLDLGTGSGAIALAIATERPDVNVMGIDKSNEALDVARTNQGRLNLSNIHFIASDWFDNVNATSFSLIVSNPPYIAEDDPHLLQGDLRFEPRSALVANDAGLAAFKQIIPAAKAYLSCGGWLVLEHGYNQARQIQQLFDEFGYVSIQTTLDYAGQPRITYGCLE